MVVNANLRYPQPNGEFYNTVKSNIQHANVLEQAGHLNVACLIRAKTKEAETRLSNALARFQSLQGDVIFNRSKVQRLLKVVQEGRAGEAAMKDFQKATKNLSDREPQMYTLEEKIPDMYVVDSIQIMQHYLAKNKMLS